MSIITEHSAKIKVELPTGDVNSKMEVFYNPVMVSNRNISVLLLNSIENKEMRLALPLEGSGIRAIRFLKELDKDKIAKIHANDLKINFPKVLEKNLQLNGLDIKKLRKEDRIAIHNRDASLFLLDCHDQDFCGHFDYVEIDPFGSPNPFLSAAVAKIKFQGILAVTATDTAALTGTYPKVTKRKYWAKSLKNHLMHELGLRILIRKVQLQGIQFDKALFPVLSYHKDHYFRIYFLSLRGKELCDGIVRQQQYLLYCPDCLDFKNSEYSREECSCKNKKMMDYAGPLWIGKLFDEKLVQKMAKDNPFLEEQKFLNVLKEESSSDFVGFYDLHVIAKKLKKEPIKMEIALKKLNCVRTHFSPTGIRTEKKMKEIMKLFE